MQERGSHSNQHDTHSSVHKPLPSRRARREWERALKRRDKKAARAAFREGDTDNAIPARDDEDQIPGTA
jgi:hypothetical protein